MEACGAGWSGEGRRGGENAGGRAARGSWAAGPLLPAAPIGRAARSPLHCRPLHMAGGRQCTGGGAEGGGERPRPPGAGAPPRAAAAVAHAAASLPACRHRCWDSRLRNCGTRPPGHCREFRASVLSCTVVHLCKSGRKAGPPEGVNVAGQVSVWAGPLNASRKPSLERDIVTLWNGRCVIQNCHQGQQFACGPLRTLVPAPVPAAAPCMPPVPLSADTDSPCGCMLVFGMLYQLRHSSTHCTSRQHVPPQGIVLGPLSAALFHDEAPTAPSRFASNPLYQAILLLSHLSKLAQPGPSLATRPGLPGLEAKMVRNRYSGMGWSLEAVGRRPRLAPRSLYAGILSVAGGRCRCAAHARRQHALMQASQE